MSCQHLEFCNTKFDSIYPLYILSFQEPLAISNKIIVDIKQQWLYFWLMGKLIDRIKSKEFLFFSKKAGSFSGVPQRTVQHWTEYGLIAPAEDTVGGTGNRRKYNILNCIQIAIIKALTDGRVKKSTVSDIMERLNGYAGERLPFLLGFDEAFLVIHLSSTAPDKPYSILYDL